MLTHLALLIALAQAPAAAVQPTPPPRAAPAKPKGPDVAKMPFTEFSIQEVVKYHLPEIQTCYNGVVMDIGKHPPEGTVMSNFTILPNGLTAKVKVNLRKTTIKNARIRDCVTDAIRNWVFPKPTDARPHPIEYPFALKVQKEK